MFEVLIYGKRGRIRGFCTAVMISKFLIGCFISAKIRIFLIISQCQEYADSDKGYMSLDH